MEVQTGREHLVQAGEKSHIVGTRGRVSRKGGFMRNRVVFPSNAKNRAVRRIWGVASTSGLTEPAVAVHGATRRLKLSSSDSKVHGGNLHFLNPPPAVSGETLEF